MAAEPEGEPSPLEPTLPDPATPDRLAQALARQDLKAMLFGAPAMPTRVGRFAVLRRIGAGGMGVVYAAYDEELDRKVALKLVRAGGPAAADRSKREAQALARLSHPNVVQVYDVGEALGQVYIAMEFVGGGTLRAWQARPGRTWREILARYVEAGRGLAAAHARGLVHRDFKPENVLLGEDGRPRVGDFGLARALVEEVADRTGPEGPGGSEASPLVTAPGAVLGTPAYMAPEQHRGAAVDARADVFGFCVALHEALHGARPFAGERREEIVEAIAAGAIEAPRAGVVPGWVQRALDRGLAADPAARWPAMEPLLAALGRDPTRWRRRALLGLLIVAAIVAAGAGVAEVIERRAQGELAAEQARTAAAEADLARARAASEARRLAALSQQLAEGDPSLRLLLAIRAVKAQLGLGEPASLEAEQALLDALSAPRSGLFTRPGAGVVDVAAESPDGAWLATGERGGALSLWRAAGGVASGAGGPLVVRSEGPPLRGLAFDPAGETLAAAATGAAIELVELRDRPGLRRPAPWDISIADPRDLAWSARGELLVRDGARALVLPPGRPAEIYGEGEAPLRRALWRPDGGALLLAGVDGRLRVHPREGGRALALEAPVRGLLSVEWSPDGRELLVGGEGGAAALLSLAGGPPLRLRGHSDEVYQVGFVPGGEDLVTVSRDGTARIWGRDGEGEVVPLEGHDEVIAGVQLGPDRQQILGAPAGGELWLWRLDLRGPPLRLRGHAGSVVHARFSADGARLLSASVDGSARRWHLADDPSLLRGHAAGIERAELLADGSALSAGLDGAVRVWPRDGRAAAQLGGHREGSSLVFAAGGAGLLVTAGSDGRVRLWDLAAWPPVPRGSLPGERAAIVDAQWEPGGERVALAGEDGRVTLLAAGPEGLRELAAIEAHTGAARVVRFTSAGALVSGGDEGLIHLWRLDPAPLRVASLAGHRGPIRSIALAGDALASGGDDGVVRVWSLAAPSSPPRERVGHTGPIAQVQLRRAGAGELAPPGLAALSASADGSARLWPEASGSEVLVGHTDAVWVAAFGAEGRTILTASADGGARLWSRRADEGLVSLLLPQRPAGGPGEPERALWTGGVSPDGRLAIVAGADGLARVHFVELADRLADACARVGRDLRADEWVRVMGARPYEATCP